MSNVELRRLRATDSDALAMIASAEWIAERIDDDDFPVWAIVVVASGEIAGYCGLFDRGDKGTTFGFAVVPHLRGQGYATAAGLAMLEFGDMSGREVYASVRPPNPASERVLAKCGLTLVRTEYDADGERRVFTR